jgi:hypothetical protein
MKGVKIKKRKINIQRSHNTEEKSGFLSAQTGQIRFKSADMQYQLVGGIT